MFSKTGKNSFLIRLPMKISIRMSILGIILTLLIGISTIIVGITYVTLDGILIKSAKYSLSYASGKVSAQISEYFKALNYDASTAFQMFDTGIVELKYSDRFIKFLYALINDDPNISGAFWGSVSGDLYWLNKGELGNFLEQTTYFGDKKVEKVFDAHGELLSVKELPFDGTDPRLRPWYKEAKLKKHLIWIIYKFLAAGAHREPIGLTAAFPFYDSKGDLLGVLGVDMLLEEISQYISDLQVTKNSAVFVVDDRGTLISIQDINQYLLGENELPKISDLKQAWLEESFSIYSKNRQSPFVYTVNNKQYISSYEKIAGVKSEHPWFVSIVTPISDITAPLRKSILTALLFIGMVLVGGVVLASVFASSLSRPIKKLAQEANLICALRLDEMKEMVSRIIEISEVEEAFGKMKIALGSFQRYMPIALVKKLIASNKVAVVGGETKELTVIFTDIQNFTSLSETIDPQELMEYLSEYFQVITNIIIEMNGTVDKYVGDGVMAFWGAPTDDSKHALHACKAVLQMQIALAQLNEKWKIEKKPLVMTRIGVNTGSVVVGNVGSDDRLNYTLLGDHVNLASRLEGINKVYGTYVAVSEFTHNQVKDEFKFRLLDRVAAKGRKQGVDVYELLGEVGVEPDLVLQQYNKEFFEAFSCYKNGDWQAAIDLFNSLGQKHPEDNLIKVFVERCKTFAANPPSDWAGVWVMTQK
jgi:adenylate cyclase